MLDKNIDDNGFLHFFFSVLENKLIHFLVRQRYYT